MEMLIIAILSLAVVFLVLVVVCLVTMLVIANEELDREREPILPVVVGDEWSESCREHCDVQMLAKALFGDQTVDRYTDKGRPHIDEIESVKAVRNHEHKCRKGGGVCSCAADEKYYRACKRTDRGIEERACKATERKIVGHELGRSCYDRYKIFKECRTVNTRHRGGDWGCYKK